MVLLIDLLKKILNKEKSYEQKELNENLDISNAAKNEYALVLPKRQPNKINFNKYINNIPSGIRDLLWFADSDYKNYNAPIRENDSFFACSLSDIEPSAIFSNLPIKEGEPEKLDYYPKYWDISPEQRYKYLSWLTNIETPIDIGYVFLFYYGLERHIIKGKYKKAFDIILKLRKIHKHSSFLSYSQEILLYACIIHKDIDLFKRFLSNTSINEIEINNLYIACLKNANLGLSAQEIISMANIVGFKNKRYIKNNYDIFCKKIESKLKEMNDSPYLKLNNYKFDLSQKSDFTMFANFANDIHNIRHIAIPSMFDNKDFLQDIYNVLEYAHNETKQELKNKRYGSKNNLG